MRRRPLENGGGMALVMAVTITALLSIMVVDFMGKVMVESSIAAGYRDETKALYAARSGQEAAKLILMADARDSSAFDGLGEEWAATGIPVPIGGEYAFVSITDESGKVDLNLMVTDRGYPNERWIEVFKRLLERSRLDPNLAYTVVDWIDENSQPGYQGAEDPYYTGLKTPYRAKNAKLDSVDELLLVKGFTPKVLAKIKENITVWSSGKVNINTATPMAIMALDDAITEGMVKSLFKVRTQKPFKSINEITRVPGFSEVFPRIALLISVNSNHYSVNSTAMFNETSKVITAVYNRSGAGTSTLYYKTL